MSSEELAVIEISGTQADTANNQNELKIRALYWLTSKNIQIHHIKDNNIAIMFPIFKFMFNDGQRLSTNEASMLMLNT